MDDMPTVADAIARACAEHGVRNAFGVPGGGSSLDLIAAFARAGIDFRLCRTETGATLMAAADAESRNGFGVALGTQGPGLANAMNGIAHACLDRAPVMFISDGWTAAQSRFDTHQVFDQRAMSAPVVKMASRLESDDPVSELAALITAMRSAPWGPVHVELTGENARRSCRIADTLSESAVSAKIDSAGQADRTAELGRLLAAARRPLLLVGLEARACGVADEILALADHWHSPILTTYKAKGVIGDDADWVVGHFTGGALEREAVAMADLIVLCGFDPVELIGRPWPYTAPVIDIGLVRHPIHYVEPAAALYGDLAGNLRRLRSKVGPALWSTAEVARLRGDMRERLAYKGSGAGLTPQQVVEIAQRAAGPASASITVDAGAHMFSAMGFWRAREAGSALISNGLATMGFALPAGIGRALHRPDRPTLVFTGDGGLMMCAGELATAAQCGARVCVIVFNDGALSLIALKQENRGLTKAGVDWQWADFAGIARGFGVAGFTATTASDYASALDEALALDGPSLIDVRIDPSGYRAQAQALRG